MAITETTRQPARYTVDRNFASGGTCLAKKKCIDDSNTIPGIRRRLREALHADDLFTVIELSEKLRSLLSPPTPAH